MRAIENHGQLLLAVTMPGKRPTAADICTAIIKSEVNASWVAAIHGAQMTAEAFAPEWAKRRINSVAEYLSAVIRERSSSRRLENAIAG